MFMNKHGYIIPDRHMINDAQKITVVLQDGRQDKARLVALRQID
jgi:serine protease DegS